MSRSVPFENVRITSGFWRGRQQATRTGSLPAMYDQMKETGRWDRLKLQWKPGDPHKPHRFWDSDVAKWLEAACYALTLAPDPVLASRVEEAVDNIRGAQQEDGYLNTYYTVVEPGKRWTNISWSHEMYDAGHLLEAALAHYTYSHSTRLLDPILKYISHIRTIFGLADGQKAGYPGHQELELALLRAYDVTGDVALLDLASYFIEERGQRRAQGHYFDIEAAARGEAPSPGPGRGPKYSYHQADRPVREMTSIEGHSVRAMYWLTAVVHLARIKKDDSLLAAANRLWESTTLRKMYVTGGLGAMPDWEGFGPDYFLPNETGYLETCAAIALVFLAHQMLLVDPTNPQYANTLELALYNAVLTGISLDGKSFFYDNPLATVDKYLQRSSWFEVSCCPPNVARLLNSLGKYIYTVGADDTIFVHLYISSEADLTLSNGQHIKLIMEADGPWEGGARIHVEGEGHEQVRLRLRCPLGASGFRLTAGRLLSAPSGDYLTVSGAAPVHVQWAYRVTRVHAHPLTLDDAACVAIMRGPFVYCAESTDNAALGDLRALRVPDDAVFTGVRDGDRFAAWGVRPAVLTTRAWAVREDGTRKEVPLTLVPVFLWANRGRSDLRVWLPRDV